MKAEEQREKFERKRQDQKDANAAAAYEKEAQIEKVKQQNEMRIEKQK